MPIVNLPESFCIFKETKKKIEVSQTNLQDIILELISLSDPNLIKLNAFVKKDKNGMYQFRGLLVSVNSKMITDVNYQLEPDDELSFIPAVSGG